MIYGSVCSGIEAVTCAWHDLGLTPAWFAEVAPFPSSVLAARWPHVSNRGDFTRIAHEAPPESVDILVGGTPCQSFSVGGRRAGLDDPRGHLAIEFLLLARRLGARWLVWENVPGVLSVDDGDAFGTFLELVAEAGYGVFWRVLDARWFGVPQRRRRVFVVGYLGDWRPPVAVLLERPSMRGNPAQSRGARAATSAGAGGGADEVGSLGSHHYRNAPDDALVADTLRGSGVGRAPDHGHISIVPIQDAQRSRLRSQNGIGIGAPGDPMYTGLTRGDHAIAFHATQDPISGSVAPAVATEPGCIGVLSFDEQQITHPENRTRPREGDPAPTLAAQSRVDVLGDMRPRRLTPREWERLQGFPDDYTLVDGADDSPRYEALGNSMAVPVMRWIGHRLVAVERVLRSVTT